MIGLVTLVVGAEKADNFGVQCVTVLGAAAAASRNGEVLRIDSGLHVQVAAAEFLVACGLLRHSSQETQFSKCFNVTQEGKAAYVAITNRQ